MAEEKDEEEVEKVLANDWFAQAMGGIAKVRLSGGVVGRMAYVIIAGLATYASIGAASAAGANPWVCGGLVLSVTFLLYRGMNWVSEYAKKNPLTATMEGAEIIVHHQLKQLSQRTKTKAKISGNQMGLIVDPDQPSLPIGKRELEEPDKQPSGEEASKPETAKEE